MPDFVTFAIIAFSAAIGAFIAFLFNKGKAIRLSNEAKAESEKENVVLCERLVSRDAQISEFKLLVGNLESSLAESTENLREKTVELSKSQERNSRISILENELREKNERINILNKNLTDLEKEISTLTTRISEERKLSEEKLKLLEEAEKKLSAEFKNIANEIFEDKSKKINERNREDLDNILKPLGEKIKTFEKKVEDTYDKESKQRFSLQNEIKQLCNLNKQMSEDTENLTKALKGESKVQGDWGELILEKTLEYSGLEKGREFDVQESAALEDGTRLRPDIVINLPEDKHLIIDSKVSLTAYDEYCSQNGDKEKDAALKKHLNSVRNHIKELGAKNYHQLYDIQSPDFVFMFIPLEPAFILAMQNDRNLFIDAFEKNIVLVSSTTLLAALKIVSSIWRYEHQGKNAIEIARQAGNLYDKFVSFSEDFLKIGKQLKTVQTSYNLAEGKLSSGKGNLIKRADDMKRLGVTTSKNMPAELKDNTDRIIDVDALD